MSYRGEKSWGSKLFNAVAILAIIALVAGTPVLIYAVIDTETPLGECVGLLDEKNPALKYEADMGNMVLGIILVETVIVPVGTFGFNLWCPVAQR